MTYKLFYYDIPFKHQVKMKNLSLNSRKGLLINKDDTWGEIAPLPNFSTEDFTSAFEEAKLLVTALNNNIEYKPTLPSVAFAKLMLEYPMTNYEDKATPYNFVLGNPTEVYLEIEKKIKEQNNQNSPITFKIKFGQYNQNDELYLIKRISLLNNIQIIVDANLQITPQIANNISQLLGKKLLYIEDPCNSLETSFNCDCNLGLDELAREQNVFNKFINNKEKNTKNKKIYLIQKPSLNLYLSSNILPKFISQTSNNINNNLILSSAFESPIGIEYLEKISTKLNLIAVGTDTQKYFIDEALDKEIFIKKFVKELK